MIREQFYNFVPKQHTVEDSLPKKIEYTLYMLSLKEWNLDSFMYRRLWNPMKLIGKKLDFMSVNRVLVFFVIVYGIGLYTVYHRDFLSENVQHYLPLVFSLFGVIMVLKSFSERIRVKLSWLLIIMNHFWVALAISFNEKFKFEQVHLYLSGIVVMGFVGYLCLRRLKKLEHSIDLDQFHGHSYKHPKIAFVFLIACLGLTGFPITPTFLGEDLIFSHIHSDQYLLASFTALSFVVDGLSIIRIFARVFLGPHSKSPTEMAYRSS
jgi:formate hydrogenlyase subunit 3/multisubunit Na+/H+ antiporter MnhD subunit